MLKSPYTGVCCMAEHVRAIHFRRIIGNGYVSEEPAPGILPLCYSRPLQLVFKLLSERRRFRKDRVKGR